MVNKIEDNEFYNEVFNYVSEVLIGIETKLFKLSEENKDLKAKLNNPDGMIIASNTLENYLNHVYRGLIDKNDEFVLDQFKRFEKYTDLNSVYLLNLISVNAMNVYQRMKRTDLKSDFDLEAYIESVRKNVEVMRKFYIVMFDNNLKKLKETKPIQDMIETNK
jgi:hypothetical protein